NAIGKAHHQPRASIHSRHSKRPKAFRAGDADCSNNVTFGFGDSNWGASGVSDRRRHVRSLSQRSASQRSAAIKMRPPSSDHASMIPISSESNGGRGVRSDGIDNNSQ